jgi:type III restriction enzyme
LDSGTENQFAQDCESLEDIEFYFKLPGWFKIDKPIGKYNPDWALIFRNEKRIYFVAETKFSINPHERRPEENMKIKCGKRHFKDFEGVEYKVVNEVGGMS